MGAALLLPMMLFAVLGTRFVAWRCHFDDVVRASCCCPDADDALPDDTTSRLDTGGCCDLQRHEIDKAPGEILSTKHVLSAPVTPSLAAVYLPRNCSAPKNVTAPTTRAGPAQGRLIVVRKHAFLI